MPIYPLRHLASRDGATDISHSPFADQDFNLDISGVASFFGADVAVSAMATVHLYEGRRWMGWYNQPGSYEIARRYGQLASSRFWDVLYPGPNSEPATLCGIDGGVDGPRYLSVTSGAAHTKTSRIACLLLEECISMPLHDSISPRESAPGTVTVVDIVDEPRLEPKLPQSTTMTLAATIPILCSCAAAAASALLGDWFCTSMILFGVAASGISYCVIGRGTLKIAMAQPHDESPHGAGIFEDSNDFVVVRGPKSALKVLTRGRIVLEYDSRPSYHDLGMCSVLLSLQLLAQLLVVPQGYLYGQLLFLASLAVSWAYNSYVSCPDLRALLRRMLFEQVLHIAPAKETGTEGSTGGRGGGRAEKYRFGTRTMMAVFALLVLAEDARDVRSLRLVLDNLLPNDTPLWALWKGEVVRNIGAKLENIQAARRDRARVVKERFRFTFPSATGHRELLQLLFDDAHAAADMYNRRHSSM
ncbi:hypothetical protein C8Q77DRAFT_1158378 [Trametes polyzona]|nr:hypothetical protein C8Q77DRAFT_1158378 [Trametes polyzona]